jgi:predicted MFS family arabinose efflux permease
MEVLRTALGSAGLRRLLTASAGTYVGIWAFTILFAIYAYDEGGAKAVGIAALVRQLPTGLAAPSICLFADRYPRRSVLVASSAAQAAAIAAVAALVSGGAPYALVLTIAALGTTAGAPFRPAQFALIPQLARTPAQIAAANVAWNAVENFGFLCGSLAAAALVGPIGLDASLALCTLPYVAGALVFVLLPRDARPDVVDVDPASARDELMAGLRTIWAHREMRLLSGVYGSEALIQGTVDVLLVICALDLLGTGDGGVGVLNTAWGAGALVGSWLALSLLGRGRLASGVAWGCVLAGVPLAIVGITAAPVLAVLMLVVLGLGYALLESALATLVQRRASDDVLARVFGVHEALFVLGTAAGGLLAAVLVSALGVASALVVTGLALPLLALGLRKRLGRLEAAVLVPQRPFELLRALRMFAPLPIATVENMAARASMLHTAAGVEIIRQGEDGDSFYVIDEGEVDVLVDGRPVAQGRPGDCMGEIALLRDQPRMATVRTRTDVRLVVLDRQEFLAGVGSHPRSATTAAHMAHERTVEAAATASAQ